MVSIFALIMILFPTNLLWLMEYQNGWIRLVYGSEIQEEWNSAWICAHCIPIYDTYETIQRYSESIGGWCKNILTSSSYSEIDIWKPNVCNLWTTSVSSSEQIQHSDHWNLEATEVSWSHLIVESQIWHLSLEKNHYFTDVLITSI